MCQLKLVNILSDLKKGKILNKNSFESQVLVKVYFSISSKIYDLDFISQELNLKPSRVYKIGQKQTYKLATENFWHLDTEYEESLDVSEQLEKIIRVLYNKSDKLVLLKEEFDLYYKFSIVIKMFTKQTPSIFLSKKEIDFASKVGADFDFDMYISIQEAQ